MQLPYHNTRLKHWNPGAALPLILPVHVICNTSDEALFENIEINSRRPGRWLESQPAHDGVALLCGGGPSIADTLPQIRLKVNQGAKVFALNGAARFLAEHGILADYQVLIDARKETSVLVGPAKAHLFASQVHPACWDYAPDARVWHLQIEGIEDHFPQDYDGGYALIGGAASVGNTATCLAYAMGFRELHCYGYDSSHREDKSHAYAQPMNDGDPCAWVDFRGQRYLCSLTMKLQAEKFQDTAKALKELGVKLFVHGSGLLPDIYNAPPEVLTEQQKYERMWQYDEYRTVAPGEHCVDAFMEIAKPHGAVIDFGCGTGRAALAMAEQGLAVTLMDFTANSRDEAARSLPFVQHDLTQPVPISAPYGFSTDMMEHIPPDDVQSVLRNVCDAADTVFFQISTVPDVCGELIGHPLHLTVQPHAWWREQLSQFGEVTFERDLGQSSLFLVRQQ